MKKQECLFCSNTAVLFVKGKRGDWFCERCAKDYLRDTKLDVTEVAKEYVTLCNLESRIYAALDMYKFTKKGTKKHVSNL